MKLEKPKRIKRKPKRLRKQARPKSESWYRKKCVAKAKEEAKERDEYTCRTCGHSARQGYQIHGSHIKNEWRYKSMSADVDNIIAQCANCHWWWHDEPTESDKWFREKYPELALELDRRSIVTKKVNWQQRYMEKYGDN